MEIHSLLDRACREGTPLIDGTTATFVWQGDWAPQVIGDFSHWEDGDAVAMDYQGEEVWACSVDLPADAYIEYVFWADGERIYDPCNPKRTSNGLGKFNHFFYTPNATPTDLAIRRKDVPHGVVLSDELKKSWFYGGGRRKVHFYQPPTEEACPLLVVWDGQDYLRRALLPVIVDNLIAQGRIRPLALAMVENGGRLRGLEYLCSEATILFLQETLLPAANQHLNLQNVAENPGVFGVLGASAGGLMALYTGLRLPHIFGHVLAQSGSYTLLGIDFPVWDLARQIDPGLLKVWMDAGSYEMLVDCNRSMAEMLGERGFNGDYHEYQGGHNFPAWRNDLGKGLEFLFGW
jgi:enterochelin esterase-like enzyme